MVAIINEKMVLDEMYSLFPTKGKCLELLAKARWGDFPICPRCTASSYTPMPRENRYHCNMCRTSFSVTERSPFHKTRIDLQKWFFAIDRVYNSFRPLSARQLAAELKVNKDTAWRIYREIKRALLDNRDFLDRIHQFIIAERTNDER
jgi:transposase-like protein